MLLPPGRIDNFRDRRSFAMLEQGEDGFLLGFTAPQGWTRVPALCNPIRPRGGRDVCENVAVRHDAIPSVATAHAPPPPKPHCGDFASGAGSASPSGLRQHVTTDAPIAVGVQSFLQGNTPRRAVSRLLSVV